MYTIWWDHAANVTRPSSTVSTLAQDLSNVFVGDLKDRDEALRVARAFREELANLGHEILVAVSN